MLKTDGRIRRTYHTSELRISLVWRQLCFGSEGERAKWRRFVASSKAGGDVRAESGVEPFDWRKIVNEDLVGELKRRGRLAADAERPPPFELALMIVNEFMRYPVDNGHATWLPWNYCASLKLLTPGSAASKAATWALRPFCGTPAVVA